jgi:Ca2+/H+ antiporter, TMEM165/GDT1 family
MQTLFIASTSMDFQALGISTLSVSMAEIGDKTQLLALVLAARYRKPWAIITAIFVATLFNHAAAAWVGAWASQFLSPSIGRWLVAGLFAAVAIWSLIPDKLDEDEAKTTHHGVFISTLIAFFLVEMGDKTQVATVLLAAHYSPLWQVVCGTTLGMLIANVPVVLLGAKYAHRLPLGAARYLAAAIFAIIAIWIVLNETHLL